MQLSFISTFFLLSAVQFGNFAAALPAPLEKRANIALPQTCFHTDASGVTSDYLPLLRSALVNVRTIGALAATSTPNMAPFGNWFSQWLPVDRFPRFKSLINAALSNDPRLSQIKFDCTTLPRECQTNQELFGARILVSNSNTNTIFACPNFFTPTGFYSNKLFRSVNDPSFQTLCTNNRVGTQQSPIGQYEWLGNVLLREVVQMKAVYEIAGQARNAVTLREGERFGIAANHIFWQRRCGVAIPASSGSSPAKI